MRRRVYTKVNEPAGVRVLIPYTKTSHTLQTVVDCLRIQQVQPELHKVGNDEGYWQMLKDAWDAGSEFFIVEQDVVVWQGGIRNLAECTEQWCTFPTMCHGRMITTTLGAVKFSTKIIERNPGLIDELPTTWFHLDAAFSDRMGWPYIRPHAHTPPATHLNEVQWSDEISTRFMLERKVVWQSQENGGEAVVRATNTEGEAIHGSVDSDIEEVA
jgi:hypothetical protein